MALAERWNEEMRSAWLYRAVAAAAEDEQKRKLFEALEKAARNIIHGAAYDNNLLCIGEKEVFVLESVADKFLAALAKGGARGLNRTQLDKLTAAAFTNKPDAGGGSHPVLNRSLVGVDGNELGDGGGVVVGTCDLVEEGPGGVAGSGGVAAGSTASATATTPTVASPEPTTAMVRRRDRTAWPRWIRSAAVVARGGAPSACRAEKVARRSSSRTITPPASSDRTRVPACAATPPGPCCSAISPCQWCSPVPSRSLRR